MPNIVQTAQWPPLMTATSQNKLAFGIVDQILPPNRRLHTEKAKAARVSKVGSFRIQGAFVGSGARDGPGQALFHSDQRALCSKGVGRVERRGVGMLTMDGASDRIPTVVGSNADLVPRLRNPMRRGASLPAALQIFPFPGFHCSGVCRFACFPGATIAGVRPARRRSEGPEHAAHSRESSRRPNDRHVPKAFAKTFSSVAASGRCRRRRR
jgi:hypothetical protein